MLKSTTGVASVAGFALTGGIGAVLVPWWLTGWRFRHPLPYWGVAEVLGVVMIAAGLIPPAHVFVQLGERTLPDPPDAHDADVRAHLFDLAEQARGREHGHAVVPELFDQVAHLAGALRVEAVGQLVQDQQLARAQQGRLRCRGAGACRASSCDTAYPPPRRAPPDPARNRCLAAVVGSNCAVGGVQPREIGLTGQIRVKGRPLDQ